MALDNNIEVVTLQTLYEINDLLFISLEYDEIIKPEMFETNELFNIHFSLLPAYKGVYTSIFPILNGEQYTGVTLHKIDSGIDTGAIVDQMKIEIKLTFTSSTLNSTIPLYRCLLDLRNKYLRSLIF